MIRPVVADWGVLAVVGQVFVTPTERWLGTLAVLVAVIAGSWAIRQIGRWLRTRYDPRGSLLEAAQAALIVATSVVATAAVLQIWDASAQATAISNVLDPDPTTVVRALVSLFLLIGAWGATVFVKRITGLLFEEHDAVSRHQHEVTYHVLQLALYSLAILVGLAVWGIDPSDILLGAGFLSVVLGLAARQTLSSVLAGFVLLFGRPFDIGDWVAIDDREGIVTDVSVFKDAFEREGITIPFPQRTLGGRPPDGLAIQSETSRGVDAESDEQ